MGIGRLDGNSAPGKVQRRRIGATPPSNIKNISGAKLSNGQPHALSAFRAHSRTRRHRGRRPTWSIPDYASPHVAHADPSGEVPLVSATLGGEVELRAARRRRRLRAVDFFRSALVTARARRDDHRIALAGRRFPRAPRLRRIFGAPRRLRHCGGPADQAAGYPEAKRARLFDFGLSH
jgi:hypothetical protein